MVARGLRDRLATRTARRRQPRRGRQGWLSLRVPTYPTVVQRLGQDQVGRAKRAAPALRCCRAGGRSSLGALILDVVLLHLAVERRAVKTQDLRRLLLVPVGALQRLNNGHLLDLG